MKPEWQKALSLHPESNSTGELSHTIVPLEECEMPLHGQQMGISQPILISCLAPLFETLFLTWKWGIDVGDDTVILWKNFFTSQSDVSLNCMKVPIIIWKGCIFKTYHTSYPVTTHKTQNSSQNNRLPALNRLLLERFE